MIFSILTFINQNQTNMKLKLLLMALVFSGFTYSTNAQDLGSLMTTLADGIKPEAFKKSWKWFGGGNSIDLMLDFTDKEYQQTLDEIKPLQQLIENYASDAGDQKYFLMEMVLWALAEHAKLNKESLINGFNFSDLFSSYLRGGELDLN